jgi:NAD(P)-dependent dehydrogenase (short-subunit alcohol dehydrogenase family)
MAATVNRFDLHGQAAVVTGGSTGIGLGIATALAEAGSDVAIWARDAERNAEAVASLSHAQPGVRVVGVQCDVSSEEQVAAAMADTVAELGRVDSFFANAGRAGAGRPFVDMSLDDWHRVNAVNLDGTFLSLRAAARHMVERGGGGSLVLTSSLTALQGAARSEDYASGKAALLALTRGLAVELARHGVRANAVVPGWIDTDLTHTMLVSDVFRDRVLPRVPARRWGTPDDIGTLAVYLASPASAYHTGDVVVVDGAYSIF